ncbi:MAG: DnaA N-terminal domain-containing protein, partial [Verrucomicrobiota bacterium]
MEKNFGLIWKSIAEAIAVQVSVDTFQRWFTAVELTHADEDHLMLQVPNNIYQLWIETNYMPLVHSAVLTVLGSPRQVKFRIATGPGGRLETPEPVEVPVPAARSRAESNPAAQNAPSNGMNPRNPF